MIDDVNFLKNCIEYVLSTRVNCRVGGGIMVPNQLIRIRLKVSFLKYEIFIYFDCKF